MAITPTSLKIRFPEFKSIDNDRVQVFIDDAVEMLNETFWSTKYNMGLSYLTAHYLFLANLSEDGDGGSVGGTIASQSVDGTSVSFANPAIKSIEASYYLSSTYGQSFWALLKTLGSGAISV